MRHRFRFIAMASLILWSADVYLISQSASSQQSPSRTVPESGFLSRQKYINAFFGFSLPLPPDAVLNEQTLSLSHGSREHFLIGFHSPNKELVAFAITATEDSSDSEWSAKQRAGLANLSKPKRVEIEGRRFWISESPQTRKGDGMKTVVFTTAMHGYVLEFKIVSYESDTTAELKSDVERPSFFDPSTSRSVAGLESKPYMPGGALFPASRIGQLTAGSLSGNVYRNEDLKFHYEFPADWVLMSRAPGKEFSQSGSQFLWGNSPEAQFEHDAANQCTKHLLFVRRFLENPATGQFNPMVVLIAADPDCVSASRFPKSVDDHESVRRIARDSAAYFRPSDSTLTGPAKVRAFLNGNHVMVEISQPFSLAVSEGAPINVFSSMFLMESGNYWVLWVFATSNSAELEQLRGARIWFDDVAAPSDTKNP